MRRLLVVLAAIAAAWAPAACGGDGDAGAQRAAAPAWIDPEGEEPVIGSLAVDPENGTVWLSTNRGLYRLRDGGPPQRVVGQLRTSLGSGRISAQLVVGFAGPGEMLGSGHPPPESGLPEVLGLLRSTDAGRTWTSVSQLGDVDFHVLEQSGNRLVGGLFGQAQVLVSGDAGRTWTTRTAPGPTTDLAVDPEDPSRWVASTADGIFVSTDEGRSWRHRDPAAGAVLAWAEADALYRADPGGAVHRSHDGGQTWSPGGDLSGSGEPVALAAAGNLNLHAATLDGAVWRSTDGGRSWRPELEP